MCPNGTRRSACGSPGRVAANRGEGAHLGSTTNAVLALREHLIAERVSLVVMEATGDYWKPFYLLEDADPVSPASWCITTTPAANTPRSASPKIISTW
jgi:hypothetical protein